MTLFAIAIWLLGETLETADRPTQAVIWGGLAFATYACGLLCLVGGRYTHLGLPRWRLGSWTLLWWAVTFGLATITWSQPQSGTSTEIAVTNVVRALWLVTVGTTAWTVGYLCGPLVTGRRSATRVMGALGRRFDTEIRSPTAAWILYAIGVGARLAGTATTGRFGYVGDVASAVNTASGYQQILGVLSLCAPLAVATAALQVFREQLPIARITLSVLFLAELAFGAVAGGKQNFVITVLAVVIPFSAARRRLPKVALTILGIIFLAVAVPFNQAYRTVVRSPSATLSPSEAVAEAPQILNQVVTANSITTVVPESMTLLLKRIREIDNPAIIIQRAPEQVGFLNPVQLVEAPLAAIVPRAAFPGKPILASGYKFSQIFYGLPPTLYTASAITPVGDLYWHGGWIPTVAGMLFLGCGMRLLDDTLDVRANPHAIFLALLLFPNLVKDEVDWVSLMAGMPGILLIWLLATAITFRRMRIS